MELEKTDLNIIMESMAMAMVMDTVMDTAMDRMKNNFHVKFFFLTKDMAIL